MILSGNLTNWSVPELLQIMRVTNKTAALRIDGPRSGVVHFRDGAIAGAELRGRSVPSDPESVFASIVDAVHVLQLIDDGSFFVAEPQLGPGGPVWGVPEVMSEVERLARLEDDIHNQGIDETTRVRLAATTGSPVTLSIEDWSAIVALTRDFSLQTLETSMGRSRAVHVLNTLVARGLTELMDGEWSVNDSPVEEPYLEPAPAPVHMPAPQPEPWIDERQPLAEPVDLTTDISVAAISSRLEAERLEEEGDDANPRRSVRGVSSSPSTTLVSGVLDDMRRLRTASSNGS
jgi:hypothetical protein